jgi:hypothetical protein
VETRLTFKSLRARRAQEPAPKGGEQPVPKSGDSLSIVRTPEAGLTWTRGGRPVSLGELIDSVPHHLVEWVVIESLRATEAAERTRDDFTELDDDLVRLALAVRGLCAPGPRSAAPAEVSLAA